MIIGGSTAIEFYSGTNTLTLEAGYTITGNVLGAGSDVLQLGGSGNASFDPSKIGSTQQYQGFGTFDVIGGDWTMTGTGSENWTIQAGTLQLGSGGTIIGNVTFAGTGTLQIDPNGVMGGSIVGAAVGDAIDFRFQSFAAGDHVVWTQSGAGVGFFQLQSSSGTVLATLAVQSSYGPNQFIAVSDNNGGTLVEVVAQPPNAPPPAGTSATMIMRDGNNGDYEIYDLGGNTIIGAGYLGQVGLEWQVVGVGPFYGLDTPDMILRDSNNGAFEIYDISNNTITGAAPMGQVGLEWSVSGFGDFSSRAGETDMLMRDSNNGQFEVYDLSNNTITSAAPMGQVGLEWSVAGFGDFSGKAGETGDMLMRNSNTGQFEVYDVTNNAITSAGPMGQVGLEWQVAGFGDFSGNLNETDMLMRNTNSGAFEIYDISNNTITSAAPMGQVGLEWSVADFGPINGAGSSDMLMRNNSTGAFEIYDIANNQITSAAPMGQVGTEWSVAGIAAVPPGGSVPANAQLIQAMASHGSTSGPVDTALPLNQSIVQPTPVAALTTLNDHSPSAA